MKILKALFTAFVLLITYGASAQPLLKTGVPFIQYNIDPGNCTKLRYHTGSEIIIPADAFEVLQGQRVTIKYRELHDHADIIMANISMNLEGGGHLETGGMFEIKAEVNGNAVSLKKGKKISVRLAGIARVKNLSAFIFDKTANNWKQLKNRIIEIPVKNSYDDDDLWGGAGPSPLESFEEDGFWWGENDWLEGNDWSGANEQWKKSEELKFEAFRAMDIDQLGLYNYDKIINEDASVRIIASFEFDEKEVNSTVYVTYKDINSVISYYPHDYKESFSLLADQEYKLFILLTDGSIASFSAENKKSLDLHQKKGDKFTFKLTREEIIPKNKEQLNTAVVVK